MNHIHIKAKNIIMRYYNNAGFLEKAKADRALNRIINEIEAEREKILNETETSKQ